MKRFALIDRDGTLNVEKHYLSDPAQLELIPGTGEALRRFRKLGMGIAVVTNQSGVARGYFDLETLAAIHRQMEDLLRAEGVTVDGIYVCPHGTKDGCDCRKPEPGLVRRAAAELAFDPSQAFVIGDKAADIALGRAVGATTILVRTGYGTETEKAGEAMPDFVLDDLLQASAMIERLLTQETMEFQAPSAG
ncbi:D-glycero-beta-D-manno-heptose 1,7-bisphosphate 7-phosphatase [Telmatospirillum sp. J64-1]|uniref:D-glycero-beta-D-manno-heptose 1,7-bisphosphate 7-phosphatase n=1 Tax=Telmatospirillum sp. J64-1 TaxID=2502183 RepID=UPI00115C5FB5|nr:D-glycero-beta-D-manno-heptose 1,7-bisphosphate 7-phosphatase [Telmatospirillum sp. J64-1]